MRAADLNHRVLIERKVVAQDPSYGTETVTWATVATLWANVQDVLPSRSEAVNNGLATATSQARVRMRYRTDIDSAMRMTINRPTPVVYQIISGPAELTQYGRHGWIEFMVERSSTP